jgi:hypothetical protein
MRNKSSEAKVEENKILILSENIINKELLGTIKVIKRMLLTIDECFTILFPRLESSNNRNTVFSSSLTPQNSVNVENEDDELSNVEWESEEKRQPTQPFSTVQQVLPTTLVSSISFLTVVVYLRFFHSLSPYTRLQEIL